MSDKLQLVYLWLLYSFSLFYFVLKLFVVIPNSLYFWNVNLHYNFELQWLKQYTLPRAHFLMFLCLKCMYIFFFHKVFINDILLFYLRAFFLEWGSVFLSIDCLLIHYFCMQYFAKSTLLHTLTVAYFFLLKKAGQLII